MIHISVKLHSSEVVKSAVANRMKSEFRNARYSHRNLHIDYLAGRHREPHIVSIAVVRILWVTYDKEMLRETPVIDVHEYRHINKYGGSRVFLL